MAMFKPVAEAAALTAVNARDCIHKEIEDAIAAGCFHVFVPVVPQEIKDELTALGYKLYNHDMSTGYEGVEIDWHV